MKFPPAVVTVYRTFAGSVVISSSLQGHNSPRLSSAGDQTSSVSVFIHGPAMFGSASQLQHIRVCFFLSRRYLIIMLYCLNSCLEQTSDESLVGLILGVCVPLEYHFCHGSRSWKHSNYQIKSMIDI